MYKCEKLSNKNLAYFSELNKRCSEFNSLNEDFFSFSAKLSLLDKIFFKRRLLLIKNEDKYIGYIWFIKEKKRQYCIKSWFLEGGEHRLSAGYYLIKKLQSNSIFFYDCIKNDFNFELLDRLGFKKDKGTIELKRELVDKELFFMEPGLSLENFICNRHEDVRCELQNNIFMNISREPLTIEDIYFDELQDYFIKDGALFLRYKGEYIGYGQIIMDNEIPIIVNLGIKDKYRHKGYGRILLKSLLNKIYDMNYRQVKIRVDSDNHIAYNLYVAEGFIQMREYYRWQLIL